jgi:signal transduction histidine kinase
LNKKISLLILLTFSIFNSLTHIIIDYSNNKKFNTIAKSTDYKDKNIITFALKIVNESNLDIYLYYLDNRDEIININDFRSNSYPILPDIKNGEVVNYSLYNTNHLITRWINKDESLYFVYYNKKFFSSFSYYFSQLLIFVIYFFIFIIFIYKEREASKRKELDIERTNKNLLLALSHEVNTPLTIIQGYVDLLHKNRKYDSNYIESIQSNIDRLENSVSDILEITNNKYFVDKKCEPASNVIEKTINNYKVFFPNKSIKLIVYNDFTVFPVLYYKLLFSNIFSNYYKHSIAESSLEVTLEEYQNTYSICIRQLPYKMYKNHNKGNGLDIIDLICEINNIKLSRDDYYNYNIEILK